VTYRFVPGIDYGPRKGTLGWNIHMAEGGNGTVGWLARRSGETDAAWRQRIRGVSAHFVVLTDGEAVQMVGWNRAAGNLNPDDRSTDKAFYGRRFLLAVLGDRWADPNGHTLSIEMCGFRRNGPTAAQEDTVAELVADGRRRFPTMVGAFGHADQTDTKGCPGTAPPMKALWERIGHGAFKEADMPGLNLQPVRPLQVGTATVRRGATAINVATRARVILPQTANGREAVGLYELEDIAGEQNGYLVDLAGGYSHVREEDVTFTPRPDGVAFNAGLVAAAAAVAAIPRR